MLNHIEPLSSQKMSPALVLVMLTEEEVVTLFPKQLHPLAALGRCWGYQQRAPSPLGVGFGRGFSALHPQESKSSESSRAAGAAPRASASAGAAARMPSR